MQHVKPRIARWRLDLQDFDFTSHYASGTGEIFSVPDAPSPYTMDVDTAMCARCLEFISEIEKVAGSLTQWLRSKKSNEEILRRRRQKKTAIWSMRYFLAFKAC